MNWTVYLLNYGAGGAYASYVERIRGRQMDFIEFIWEKALVSRMYDVYAAKADSLKELEESLTTRMPVDYHFRAMAAGDVAIDERGNPYVFLGTDWMPSSASWDLNNCSVRRDSDKSRRPAPAPSKHED